MSKEKRPEQVQSREVAEASTSTVVPTIQEIRVTPTELAEKLNKNPIFELNADTKLIIHDINTNDFISAISAVDQPKRLQVFFEIMKKFSIDLSLEGSITLGEFDVGSHSWALTAGESGSLKMAAEPATVVKSISEIVSFLDTVSPGKGFPLKANQNLLITGMSSGAMLDYYRLCQETEDSAAREKGQDDLFKLASELLRFKGLNLRIYGLNTAQVDRNIDVNAGGIFFKATAQDDIKTPHLILTLLPDAADSK